MNPLCGSPSGLTTRSTVAEREGDCSTSSDLARRRRANSPHGRFAKGDGQWEPTATSMSPPATTTDPFDAVAGSTPIDLSARVAGPSDAQATSANSNDPARKGSAHALLRMYGNLHASRWENLFGKGQGRAPGQKIYGMGSGHRSPNHGSIPRTNAVLVGRLRSRRSHGQPPFAARRAWSSFMPHGQARQPRLGPYSGLGDNPALRRLRT
jgi:hypothetical protein